jgi:hypothetical protein
LASKKSKTKHHENSKNESKLSRPNSLNYGAKSSNKNKNDRKSVKNSFERKENEAKNLPAEELLELGK